MSEYPVQIGKVQPPPLRDETLERTRLLDWLHVKIHRRVVLVLAEAGYGKTTLLADFSRRSRVRALWFRLDRGDRDWVGFLAYLVAAVRIHLPSFAPVTQSLLREAGGSLPPRDTVLDTFIRELGDLPADPTALILDDVHAVDDSIDVRTILRELLARAPERLTFVLISRKVPPIPLARLRALGEVAELRTSELRFDASETEQLFRETYALALEPSVVAELSRRTEGWAASLQLVRTAIRDRSPSEIRSFVNSLSGAEGELYDYLAEEVVGELSQELQQFLMRTSLLDIVEPLLGSVAAETSPDETRAAIAEGELIGLFNRTGPQARDQVRAHPLVRDFLQARLRRSVGVEEVIAIHRAIAIAAETIDWRISCSHYAAAGDLDEARRVLAAAIEAILATGAYAAAEVIADALPPKPLPDATVAIIASRMAMKRGDREGALTHARSAVDAAPDSEVALWNALMISASCSALDEMAGIDARLRGLSSPPIRRLSSQAIVAGIQSSVDGDLDLAARLNSEAARASLEEGNTHFRGVALTNLAQILRVQGDAPGALESALEAISALESTSSGVELVSARLAAAWAQAHLGQMPAARDLYNQGLAETVRPVETAFEAADIEVFYGDREQAESLLNRIGTDLDPMDEVGEQATLTWIAADVRGGDAQAAQQRIATLSFGRPATGPAIEARRHVALAEVEALVNSPTATRASRSAREVAARQRAHLWSKYSELLELLRESHGGRVSLPAWVRREPAYLSMAAEATCRAIDKLDEEAFTLALAEARTRPDRWRPALRQMVRDGSGQRQLRCASILEEVGTLQDVPLLRRTARQGRGRARSSLGRGLARRLAAPLYVRDLGRVEIHIGDRIVDGSQVRRKVLALLCLLLTKPDMAASREEIIDALWPDSDPAAALNSLNQTVYFLRRVIEPDYHEDLSPGYVEQSSETLWLDRDLISSRSRTCRRLLREVRGDPTPEQALAIAQAYQGRFALDFLYEDWSAEYRDSLHAAYLRVIEVALRLDLNSGHYLRGIEVAQLAAEVEPESEDIQLALLRFYRLSGSLAAAAEQYGHYARTLREIGIEPQPLSAI
ncbi:MAG: winged helix-turn-helix domain-containing protein [Chloroflexi bacterium]|nr:winged helix-turn-helix domain-containing protein [Chloroflexota bacterium]